jgi:hypothetical protein
MKSINIISEPNSILEALLDSKMNNTVIGIHAKLLGPATFLTAVNEIVLQAGAEPLIILADCDTAGHSLPVNTLRLSEIKNVIPFASPFKNPILKNYLRPELMNSN